MTTDNDRDERDLQFIQANKNAFFDTPNHYLGILRGRIKVPHTVSLDTNDLSEEELRTLSFGQFVNYMAQRRQLDMDSCAKHLGIDRNELVEIYDDLTFPWELDPMFVKRIGMVLQVSISILRLIIRDHPMDDWVLKQHLPQGFSAARSTQKLESSARMTELDQAELLLQRDREEEKRNRFLSQL